jgi:hypothetical protein
VIVDGGINDMLFAFGDEIVSLPSETDGYTDFVKTFFENENIKRAQELIGEQKFGPVFVVTIRKPDVVDPLTSLENTVDNMIVQQQTISMAIEDIKDHVK